MWRSVPLALALNGKCPGEIAFGAGEQLALTSWGVGLTLWLEWRLMEVVGMTFDVGVEVDAGGGESPARAPEKSQWIACRMQGVHSGFISSH